MRYYGPIKKSRRDKKMTYIGRWKKEWERVTKKDELVKVKGQRRQ